MHRLFITALITAAVAGFAQVPTSELAKPPSDARHFVIQSTGGKHGDSWSWTAADGTRRGRESMNLRGQVFELDSSGTAGADGMPSTITIRGVTPTGDAGETFVVAGNSAKWKSPVDSGTAKYSAPAFYVSQGGPIDMAAWFLEALLARPDKSLDLLPGGKARAAKLTDLQVGERRGGADHHALVGHGHQHVAAADLGRREQQVLRADRRLLAAGGLRRRTERRSKRLRPPRWPRRPQDWRRAW